MDAVELIVRLGLAVVFAISGVAKLLDPAGSREALEAFGAPRWAARPGAYLLPVAELAVAALLAFEATAFAGALAATALLWAFCVAVLRSIARGEAPDCHCFGRLRSEPVGWGTFLRNVALLAAAVVAAAAAAG